jgi:LemA protein
MEAFTPWIVWIGLGLLIVWLVFLYNGLVGGRNALKNAFAQIDVQLRRRHDLIPNLIQVCKAYLAHESATLEAVVQARLGAQAATKSGRQSPGKPEAMRAMAEAEGQLSSSLGRLIAVAESYPELKAQLATAQLTEELASTENRIGFARQAFNDAVTDFNTQRETFPAILFSSLLGFQTATLLSSVENTAQRLAPVVSF